MVVHYYTQQEVSPDVKEEILNNYNTEDIMKLTTDGIITNLSAWSLK